MIGAVLAGTLVFWKLVLNGPAPHFDEARHLLQGARIAYDLEKGDLWALAIDTYLQIYWPPLHAWLVALASLVAGPGPEAGRAVSVLSYVLLAPVLFLLARMLELRHGVAAGMLAAALALTSPGLVQYASQAMLEAPGLLAVSFAMLVYCALERAPDAPPRAHLVLGLSLVLAYLIKTNYGVLLVITLLLARLLSARFRLRHLLTGENLYAALPLVLFCLVWFAWPLKIVWTWGALVNQPWGGEEARGIAGLLFFPRALMDFAGSWWLAALLWIGLGMAWRIRRRPGVAFVALLPLILFVIGEIHHTKLDRHILPMLPPMYVLTAVAGARAWAALRARGPAGTALAVVALASVALLHAGELESRSWEEADREVDDVLDFVAGRAAAGAPALVVGSRDAHPSPPGIDFHLVSKELLPVTAAEAVMDPARDRWLRSRILPAGRWRRVRASLRRVLYRYDRGTRTRSFHVGHRGPMSAARFATLVSTTIRRNPPRTIILVIETRDPTPYTEEFVAPAFLRAGYRRVSMRDFPQAGARVYLYERPPEGRDGFGRGTASSSRLAGAIEFPGRTKAPRTASGAFVDAGGPG